MLIKEYRIPLPLTVEEYRVAQLYMIAKKSREETRGAGSGVEILVNEPYVDGPGGCGQYTHKIYHIGSHLPGWFKALLPKSALTVEEEAWNAYPYTKTRYTCPFVEKFFLEIETKYFGDIGSQENVFELNGGDLRNRVVDEIDVVRDQLYGSDYKKEEDPKFFVSQVTGRGPLMDNWLEDHQGVIMCAYKLCRVEFKYWGMQSKIERFIHEVALRKTMLRAHRQAWAWQDEWVGLTMEDIRRLEKETQEALARKMQGDEALLREEQPPLHTSMSGLSGQGEVDLAAIDKDKDLASPHLAKPLTLHFEANCREREGGEANAGDGRRKLWSRSSSKAALNSPSGSSTKSFDVHLANWRMDSIVRRDSETTSDEEEDEFFDAEDDEHFAPLTKWSSLEAIGSEQGTPDGDDTTVFSRRGTRRGDQPPQPCPTSVLLMVVHGGSILDCGAESLPGKTSDLSTFRGVLEVVVRQHYPALVGRIALRLVSCPPVCAESLAVLCSLSPYSFQASPSTLDGVCSTNDAIPMGALPLFAISSPEYQESVSRVVAQANHTYHEFLRSEEGCGFCGQVAMLGDSVGSLLCYDALCRTAQYGSHYGSENSVSELDQNPATVTTPRANPLISVSDGSGAEEAGEGEVRHQRTPSSRVYRKSHSHPQDPDSAFVDPTSKLCELDGQRCSRLLSAPLPRRRSSCSSDQSSHHKLDFEVSDLFVCGSPLGTVLAYRRVLLFDDKNAAPVRPFCGQVYNLFHPTDPCTSRIEPLLHPRFSLLPPVNIPRYQKYPLGDGEPTHLVEYLQSHAHVFVEGAPPHPHHNTMVRRTSETASICSTISGLSESIPMATVSALTQKWWGSKRLDYALYCPEGLANFPANALPHLFHASYWESTDVVAFVLRLMTRSQDLSLAGEKEPPLFIPSQPREKWQRKRTSVKLKNVTANHRANDVIVKDGAPQIITARFVYGPLDMVALSGEKVDVHVMRDPRTGEWALLTTEVTDKSGRITYTIPREKILGYGMFPVKMVVRGDHTAIDFFMAVIPPKTECVVFSIDGSFTASVSVTGKDPKVRAGAVDVVRHWQELGYLIVYVTGRPDMQQQRVVSWLAQHNFPHGLVSFADGFSTDPLRHKAEYLRNLVANADIVIHAAYGSSKDIWVYSSVGVPPERIFIVGKASKKQHTLSTVLIEGYAAHLGDLKSPGGSRPARGNARMIIPRGCFGLPGGSTIRHRSAKRTTSYPLSGEGKSRGLSPKP